jgi:hypothetical protein
VIDGKSNKDFKKSSPEDDEDAEEDEEVMSLKSARSAKLDLARYGVAIASRKKMKMMRLLFVALTALGFGYGDLTEYMEISADDILADIADLDVGVWPDDFLFGDEDSMTTDVTGFFLHEYNVWRVIRR